MTAKQELLALAERVEKGEQSTGISGTGILTDIRNALGTFIPTYVLTSLDAAKSLHDAVLPGWFWSIHVSDGTDMSQAIVSKWSEDAEYRSSAPTPAAAWVAAILRAKAEEV